MTRRWPCIVVAMLCCLLAVATSLSAETIVGSYTYNVHLSPRHRGPARAERADPMTDHAKRVATTLNRFVGMLHAARCTATLWILHAEDSRYKNAAKYGLQMTFGTAMLTLRKFQDLSTSGRLRTLIPEGTKAHTFSEWVLRECEQHNTRPAANLLFAHYAPHKTDLPLSDREIRALGEDGGWTTEEEVVEWLASIIDVLRGFDSSEPR